MRLKKSVTHDHGLYLLLAIILMNEISIPKNGIQRQKSSRETLNWTT